MDEMLARLNRIYPNSKYAKIPKYMPEQWTDREYDSKYDNKAALNKWKSYPLDYDAAQDAVEQGYRIAWIVPKNLVVVDVDNIDHVESQERLEHILETFECKYSYNKTSRGIHFLFQDTSGNIKSDSHCKCALNIDVDTRANETGYIILPCNDPHRAWGEWSDFVEEIPYFLIPLMRDATPSFIGMVDGDGRNTALFKWRTKLIQTHKLDEGQIEKSIRTINEYLFDTPMANSELFKTVLKERDTKDKVSPLDKNNVYNEVAENIIAKFDIISFGDQFYQFNGTYYKPIRMIDIEKIIHFEISKNICKTGRKEIADFLRIKTQVTADQFDKDWYKIAVANGVLNLVTGEVTTPTKMDINTIYIPYNYNPDPPISSRVNQFMIDICNADPIKMTFLYQVAGYCLLKKNMFEKFFVFQGEGGTGKSTFMNLIHKMVGGDINTSHISLSDMDKDYYLATMLSKLVNIDDDVVDGKTLENTGRFKSIISGNIISVRQIYQEVMSFVPYATCMFSCNKLPRILDKTSGLYRRIVLVELNHKVEKPDPVFLLKLSDADMEYFLFKAVEGIKLAIEEGRFRINASEQDLLRKFRCRQSSLNEWLYENDIKLGDLIGKRCLSLYNQFISWAQENGYIRQMSMFTFKEDICALYDMEIEKEVRDDKVTNTQIFVKRGKLEHSFSPF